MAHSRHGKPGTQGFVLAHPVLPGGSRIANILPCNLLVTLCLSLLLRSPGVVCHASRTATRMPKHHTRLRHPVVSTPLRYRLEALAHYGVGGRHSGRDHGLSTPAMRIAHNPGTRAI